MSSPIKGGASASSSSSSSSSAAAAASAAPAAAAASSAASSSTTTPRFPGLEQSAQKPKYAKKMEAADLSGRNLEAQYRYNRDEMNKVEADTELMAKIAKAIKDKPTSPIFVALESNIVERQKDIANDFFPALEIHHKVKKGALAKIIFDKVKKQFCGDTDLQLPEDCGDLGVANESGEGYSKGDLVLLQGNPTEVSAANANNVLRGKVHRGGGGVVANVRIPLAHLNWAQLVRPPK